MTDQAAIDCAAEAMREFSISHPKDDPVSSWQSFAAVGIDALVAGGHYVPVGDLRGWVLYDKQRERAEAAEAEVERLRASLQTVVHLDQHVQVTSYGDLDAGDTLRTWNEWRAEARAFLALPEEPS